jgi:aminoglycoside phosphotransferase (APT) family kinase protein
MTAHETKSMGQIRNGLTQWLEGQWTSVTDLELSGFCTPEVGASAQTLFFDALWKEQGRTRKRSLVARLKPGSEFHVFPDCDPAREYRIMSLLSGTGVPVPKMFGYEPDDTVIGSPFYLMERIEGRLFVENPPYHIQGWVADCTPEERAEMWFSGIDSFSRVHKLDWKALGFQFLNHPEWGDTPLDQQLQYWQDYYKWMLEAGDRHPLCEEALAWLQVHKPSDEPVTLCWGDAKVGNMVFRGTECVGLLDWEMARLGNPVEDLVWYMILDRILWEGIGIPRLPGFSGRDETIRHWEWVSGFRAGEAEYYEILGALKISLILYRIYNMQRANGVALPTSDWVVNNNATAILAKEMASKR